MKELLQAILTEKAARSAEQAETAAVRQVAFEPWANE
jgi:hypothetical protein